MIPLARQLISSQYGPSVRNYCTKNTIEKAGIFKKASQMLQGKHQEVIGHVKSKAQNLTSALGEVPGTATELAGKAVEQTQGIVQGAKAAAQNLSHGADGISHALKDAQTAIIDTARTARRMFQIASWAIVGCGSLFGLGIAADSTAKIFENYDRIRKVIENNKQKPAIEDITNK